MIFLQLHAQWGPIIMLAWMCVSSADSIFTIILFSVACSVGTYHNACLDVCQFCWFYITIILFSVACPVGTYHNASLDVCQYCSRGSYQNLEGQRYCFMCRPGQTSPDGATHKTQCKHWDLIYVFLIFLWKIKWHIFWGKKCLFVKKRSNSKMFNKILLNLNFFKSKVVHKGFNQEGSKRQAIQSALTLCLLGNFSCFFVVCWFFSKSTFTKNSFRNTIRVSNISDPDQASRFVRPDLGPNCLQMLSEDETSRQRQKVQKNVYAGFWYIRVLCCTTRPFWNFGTKGAFWNRLRRSCSYIMFYYIIYK